MHSVSTMMENKKAVILLSGGLDSATCLAIANAQGFSCYCLSFDYGQKHAPELEASKVVAETLGAAAHRIIPIPSFLFQGSALVGAEVSTLSVRDETGIPASYVPARNALFLSFALSFAESIGALDIFIGVTAVDYSGYPDCRPEFIEAFELMANRATRIGAAGKHLSIQTPLIKLAKSQIIRQGHALGIDYAMTVSCYQANAKGEACGQCESCYFRRLGFSESGVADSTRYVR